MKRIKSWKLFESLVSDFDTIEDIFQEFKDDRKCVIDRFNDHLSVFVVDDLTFKSAKSIIDSWGFRSIITFPSNLPVEIKLNWLDSEYKDCEKIYGKDGQWWVFRFYSDQLVQSFVNFLNKVKNKQQLGDKVYWRDETNEILFEHDLSQRKFVIKKDIWKFFERIFANSFNPSDEVTLFTRFVLRDKFEIKNITCVEGNSE